MTVVIAPGRVNLIGEHTDYTGGLVLPIAIDRWTRIELAAPLDLERIVLDSVDEPVRADLPLRVTDPSKTTPSWARYVAGVVAQMNPSQGIRGTITTEIPIGAGLSSSAALEVAVALALGNVDDPVALAQLCRRAEIDASGVPCGIMDQLAITASVAGHASLIDCHALTIEPIPIPDELEVVVEFIAHRILDGSPYADRVAECAAAEAQVGPLWEANAGDVTGIADPLIRARARHVVTENQRVRDFVAALYENDARSAGQLMVASHASMRDDFDITTPQMDAAVERAIANPGVYGARMTGGGFGGCIVALTEPGALDRGWVVKAVDGAVTANRS